MTITAFQPTASAPFQFQATLDGQVYTVIITWGLFGQRWYTNIYALDGTRILTLPLIGSPDDYDISLTKGYFNSTMIFRGTSQRFEVLP